jgi:hypothetical protein
MRKLPDRPLNQEEAGRLEQAEQKALQMLNNALNEGRWYPRRYMRLSLLLLAAVVATLVIVLLLGQPFLLPNAHPLSG